MQMSYDGGVPVVMYSLAVDDKLDVVITIGGIRVIAEDLKIILTLVPKKLSSCDQLYEILTPSESSFSAAEAVDN